MRRLLRFVGVLGLATTGWALVPAAPAPAATSPSLVGLDALAYLTLPQPEDSPADPNAVVPIEPMFTIDIPRLGIATTVNEGVEQMVIDAGPAHWPGSAMPGGYGNTVIAAHRVSHTAPFRNIDRLAPGDEIVLRDGGGDHVYRVTGTDIVTPAEIGIVDQYPGRKITLFACHPPGSVAYRYVVVGELVSGAA
jgi:sortase A